MLPAPPGPAGAAAIGSAPPAPPSALAAATSSEPNCSAGSKDAFRVSAPPDCPPPINPLIPPPMPGPPGIAPGMAPAPPGIAPASAPAIPPAAAPAASAAAAAPPGVPPRSSIIRICLILELTIESQPNCSLMFATPCSRVRYNQMSSCESRIWTVLGGIGDVPQLKVGINSIGKSTRPSPVVASNGLTI